MPLNFGVMPLPTSERERHAPVETGSGKLGCSNPSAGAWRARWIAGSDRRLSASSPASRSRAPDGNSELAPFGHQEMRGGRAVRLGLARSGAPRSHRCASSLAGEHRWGSRPRRHNTALLLAARYAIVSSLVAATRAAADRKRWADKRPADQFSAGRVDQDRAASAAGGNSWHSWFF